MTNLECAVTTCAYHSGNRCRKNAVCVNGHHASTKDQTCCESFEQRTAAETGHTQATQPLAATEIRCGADQCAFYTGGSCAAQHISVCSCGCKNPCSCQETECASFRQKG